MIEEIAKSGCGLGDFSLQKSILFCFTPFIPLPTVPPIAGLTFFGD